jgi:single-strand DNA-binding protein
MNQVMITGHLGADPEVAFSGDGAKWANFSLANKVNKNKTVWIKVVCFDKKAEICETYLHKGAKVLISGSLDQDHWETKTNEKRSMHKLIAHNIEFIKTDGRGLTNGEEAPF